MEHAAMMLGAPDGVRLHEPFLERAAENGDGGHAHALGAFLVLRVVDQFAPARGGMGSEALSYQITAATQFIEDLRPQTPELSHLREVLRISESTRASGNRRLLWPSLLAFAYLLEQDLRLAEALDVLDTALGLSDGNAHDEAVAAYLQRGRVLRRSTRLDEATRAYSTGGELARQLGDRHSERLSRIGRAIVLQKLGNLPASEGMLRDVLADAAQDGDRDAEARARHDLAAALSHQGRASEAVPLAYQAFCLYERALDRQRALSDLGAALKSLGHHRAAEDAFHVVLSCQGGPVIRVNAMLELLEIASLTRNRVAFERWRRDLGALEESMPPEARVEYEIELGRGFAAFGQVQRGQRCLESAIHRAEEHRLNECVFRAEAALRDLARQPEPGTETVGWADDPAVSDVANELHQLRVAI